MTWYSFPAMSPLWDFIVAQTPSLPSPSPTSSDLELLKTQLEFLTESNTRLNESFVKFMDAMKFTLFAFGALGGFATFIFGKSLSEARQLASQIVRQEVESQINQQVKKAVSDEADYVERMLERERVVSKISVDYYLPAIASITTEYQLLKGRGFQQVRLWTPQDTVQSTGHVVVLDLVNSNVLTSEMTDEQRENTVQFYIDEIWTRWAKGTTVLVIYVRPGAKRINAIDRQPADVYYASANTPVTLMGVVTDCAYVADARRKIRG